MRSALRILFLAACLQASSSQETKFDNAVVGQPWISCEKDRIVVEVETQRPFNGKMFVKGDYSNEKCLKTFIGGKVLPKSQEGQGQRRVVEEGSIRMPDGWTDDDVTPPKESWTGVGGASQSGKAAFGGTRGEEKLPGQEELHVFKKGESLASTFPPVQSPSCPPQPKCEPCECGVARETRKRRETNRVRLEVPLDSCSSKRDRMLNPPSLVVSFVAVVSFHDSFITKLDKAYHIQCAYTETDKQVSTEINVSMAPETDLSGTISPPTCEYLISNQGGSPITNSLVGELVRHEWKCHVAVTGVYKMLVHDCFVEDGSGQNFQVIDTHGCTLDKHMLQTPNYNESGLSASVDAFVFKFPDRSNVDFRCSITFCSVQDGECERITPPSCHEVSNEISKKRKKRAMSRMQSLSLHANSLTVLDVDTDGGDPSIPQALLSEPPPAPESFCLSVGGFGILVSASTFLSTVSATTVFAYFYVRYSEKYT